MVVASPAYSSSSGASLPKTNGMSGELGDIVSMKVAFLVWAMRLNPRPVISPVHRITRFEVRLYLMPVQMVSTCITPVMFLTNRHNLCNSIFCTMVVYYFQEYFIVCNHELRKREQRKLSVYYTWRGRPFFIRCCLHHTAPQFEVVSSYMSL